MTALTAGSRLGPYQIVEQVGVGGPADVRACHLVRELWRGLAGANLGGRR